MNENHSMCRKMIHVVLCCNWRLLMIYREDVVQGDSIFVQPWYSFKLWIWSNDNRSMGGGSIFAANHMWNSNLQSDHAILDLCQDKLFLGSLQFLRPP
jgi:hypothetical protein